MYKRDIRYCSIYYGGYFQHFCSSMVYDMKLLGLPIRRIVVACVLET